MFQMRREFAETIQLCETLASEKVMSQSHSLFCIFKPKTSYSLIFCIKMHEKRRNLFQQQAFIQATQGLCISGINAYHCLN